MKIAIMGTGGVGGYYGGLLAVAGHDVVFIARGAHLEAIRKNGLAVKSVFGNFRVQPATATDNPASIGPVDLVLFSTKTYGTEEAAQAIVPITGRDTAVISFQNGVEAAEKIGRVVGHEHMIGGVTWLSAAIEELGVISQYSQFRRIDIGEFSGEVTQRTEMIAEVLKSTGADVEVVTNIVQVLWTKFVFISAISALGGLTRVATGDYRSVPESRAVLIGALNEVIAVAGAKGIRLEPDLVAKTLEFIDGAPPAMLPSMQRDIEAGRRSELESMIGVVVRLGAELNVPTPIMALAYAALKPGHLKASRVK